MQEAFRKSRPLPRNRARSVSNCSTPSVSPSTTLTWNIHRVRSAGSRLRRVARTVPLSASNSVCTNIFENAGCAASAPGAANTTSA
jgi:hypothetical protein